MPDGSIPRFLQGVFHFEGRGLDLPEPLHDSLRYTVPPGASTQPVYFRGGNSAEEMICLTLVVTAQPVAGLATLGSHAPVVHSRVRRSRALWPCLAPVWR